MSDGTLKFSRGLRPLKQISKWGPFLALSLFVLFLCGCVTQRAPLAVLLPVSDSAAIRNAQKAADELFPLSYRAVHRVIITVTGKQFTCDGLLTASPSDGFHLAVVSSMGVVTDLRVRSNGASEVLKVTPLFREQWAREFVTRDLFWFFMPHGPLEPAGQTRDGQLVLRSSATKEGLFADYQFSTDGRQLQEVRLCHKGRVVCTAAYRRYRKFDGGVAPSEVEVRGRTYQLNIRIAQLAASQAQSSRGDK